MSQLPAVICIGAQKAGTSWLHENLASHPRIWVPPFKELHFFDFKFVEDSKKWAKWHIRSNVKKLLTRGNLTADQERHLRSLMEEPILNGTWYKRVFSAMPAGRVGLDVTPEYSTLPAEGISFMKKYLPDPHIIYIIRDPVERAISQAKMNMKRKGLSLDDAECWLEAVREPVITARGDYARYLPLWDDSGMRVSYMAFGDITRKPKDFLREVEQFCGLAPAEYPAAHRPVFPTGPGNAPDSVRALLEERLTSQREFLAQRFGAEFVSRT
ncbi:sulfotransferase [Xinfangfangia sp. D13-10-4-6]|uniref:sulfotransferase family protein n=1 Tax=Pseudogemmobacter hezensis TaxID=2737662 RepID=UPI001555B7DB|nr:sulfotransferase [Pseudogemmobacter hezensis]NPD17764.1 sulfotransferase [Pseudogemmobacter hezensis]